MSILLKKYFRKSDREVPFSNLENLCLSSRSDYSPDVSHSRRAERAISNESTTANPSCSIAEAQPHIVVYAENVECVPEVNEVAPIARPVIPKESVESEVAEDKENQTPNITASKPSFLNKHQNKQEKSSVIVEEEENLLEAMFSKIRHGRYQQVKQLLADGFNPLSVDVNGNTMLHICAQNNHVKLASLVTKFGCPLDRRNKKNITAIDYATMYNFDEFIDWYESVYI